MKLVMQVVYKMLMTWSVGRRINVCQTVNQGCGVGSPVIRLLAISIIQLRLRTDSDLQLY